MSHPYYNPFAPGSKNSTQGQYGRSNSESERDPRRAANFLGPSSSFSSSGAPPMTPENSGRTLSSSMNFRPEPSRANRDEDTRNLIEMHISRAREEVRQSSTPMLQPMDQGARFASTQRDDFRSAGTGMASYPMSSASASQGHRHEMNMNIESGKSALDWLSKYTRPSADGSTMSSSGLSNYTSGDGGRLNKPVERDHDMHSIPGLGDHDFPDSTKTSAPTDSSQSTYTSESAAGILLRFGLEKEDLEHLISYPEDQITPESLPFILREIRLQKDKRQATAAQPKLHLEPQPPRAASGVERYPLNSSGGTMLHQEKTAAPSKVIDYGHTGKYTAAIGEEFARRNDGESSGGGENFFLSREPLPVSSKEFKSSAMGSSNEQASPFSGQSSSYSSVQRPVVSTSSNPTKRLQVQPNLTFQDILNSLSKLNKDRERSGLKSEAPRPVPSNQPEAELKSSLKTQPAPSQSHGVHPSRPGLLLIGSNAPSGPKNQSKTPGQATPQPSQKPAVKQSQKLPPKQPSQKQPTQKKPSQHQPSKKPTELPRKRPASQTRQVAKSRESGKSAPHSDATQRQMKPAAPKRQLKDKVAVSKDQPTPEMMFDYAAASPKVFPHTCVLCNKDCTNMTDWISHQNSNFHLESCRLLRKQFPKWDGEISLDPRTAGKASKPSTSASAKNTRHGSRSHSRSISPHYPPGKKRRSRSRSPQGPKYNRRYDYPTTSSYRSRSQSPERRASPRRKGERPSSPRRDRERRSPPRRSSDSWSPQRRGSEKWSPQRRGEGSRSPLRKADSRWTPPKRLDKRASPQRRVVERRSSPKRSRSSTRSQERRSSREGSSPRQKGQSSAESLAKKLLETPGVQLLSNTSDLDAVVKTLAPALLAELTRMSGGQSPLPASSSTKRKKVPSSAPTSYSSSSAAKKAGSASKTSKEKLSAKKWETRVTIQGVRRGMTTDDISAAVEKCCQTKSFTVSIFQCQGHIFFERKEDALRLMTFKELRIKGVSLPILKKRVKRELHPTASPEPTRRRPQVPTGPEAVLWSPLSGTFPQPSRKVLLPTPKFPQLMQLPVSKTTDTSLRHTAAVKDLTKASKTVNRAKAILAKVKTVSTKVISKTATKAKVPAKKGLKTAVKKKEPSSESKSTSAVNKPKIEDSKPGVEAKANVEETTVKDSSLPSAELPSGSSASQVQSGTGTSDISHSESKVQKPFKKDTVEAGKASPPTVVKLHGILNTHSHIQVRAAVEQFGKTKSIVLFRSKSEAIVIFEKEEDAKKLKNVKSLYVDKVKITVNGESTGLAKESVIKTENKAEHTDPAKETATQDEEVIYISTTQKPQTSGEANTKPQIEESLDNPKDTPKALDKVVKADKVDEQMELGGPEVKVAELVKLGTSTEREYTEESESAEAVLGHSADKPNEAEPADSSAVTTPRAAASTRDDTRTAESVSTEKKPETLDEKLHADKDNIEKEASMPSKATSVDDSEPKCNPEIPETSPERTGEVGKSDELPDTASVKSQLIEASKEGRISKNEDKSAELAGEPSVKEVVLASQEETVSTTEEPGTQIQGLHIEESSAKDENKPPEPADSANQPFGESLKPNQSESKAEEPLEISKALTELAERVDQDKVDAADEPMELGSSEQAELVDVNSCTEGQVMETVHSGAVPDISRDGINESMPPTRTAETQPTEILVNEPESSAQEAAVSTGASQVQDQATVMQEGGPEATKATQEVVVVDDASTADTTKRDPTSTEGSPIPVVGGVSGISAVKTKPTVTTESRQSSRPSSSAAIQPTIGEMLENHLFAKNIFCIAVPGYRSAQTSYIQQLLICGLPKYHDGLYTEEDVAKVLAPYGFVDKDENLYVFPQTRMAFAMMPTEKDVYKILKESRQNGIYFGSHKLTIKIVRLRYQMKVLQFYRFLKKLMKCPVFDEGFRTFLIRNISNAEAKKLREALQDFGPVSNFMPLLNKLFVEFESPGDAVNFESWYQQMDQAAGHEIVSMGFAAPWPVETTQPGTAQDVHLTFGEKFEAYLTKPLIASLKCKNVTTSNMMITMLPTYKEDSYTESDIIKLLTPFGYRHKDHNMFVVPQACLAFVQMPSQRQVSDIIKRFKTDPILLNGTELSFHATDDTIGMSPFRFYKSLMELVGFYVREDRERFIFIRNISPAETKKLREVLEQTGTVRNFLPLLNKVFVEFRSIFDADWLGVWYSLLKEPPSYIIQRLKIPSYNSLPPSPSVSEEALLKSEDLIERATIPSGKNGIPLGSASPFWISMRKSPFVFPTLSPWFIIPEFNTVKSMGDVTRASRRGSMCPTVMLTGFPEGNYKHEDVARYVWPYFAKQNLQSLYYNVTVLPLQRRAFVFFADWTSCCNFVKAHIMKHMYIKRQPIVIHIVLQNMYPESSEELMYKSLMKWSNTGNPDPTTLEERLLCVEVSEVSLDVITLVIEMVASITPFVNYLPLANRICIEMADSGGVDKVVEKYNDPCPNSFTVDPAWSKVKSFESMKTLKQRLQDSAEVTINFEPVKTRGKNKSPEIDKDMLKSITVTVGEQRVIHKGRSQGVEKQELDDFTEDSISSDAHPDAYLFDEEQFNEGDFVTVDEVYDDAEDRSPEHHHHSSSKQSSRDRRETRSSGSSSSRQRTSTRSSKDHKSPVSTASSSSNKASRSSHSKSSSSRPTKLSTKTSSSSRSGKTSSSPSVSTETSSVQQSSKKSAEPSNSKSSSGSEGEKSTFSLSSKDSAETEKVGEEANDSEDAVANSEHMVSAEGTTAETVESETKIETGEMHPPQQEHGLDLNQTQDEEIGLNSKKEQMGNKDDKETESKELDSGTCLDPNLPGEQVILDLVETEAADKEPTVTRRSTRAKRGQATATEPQGREKTPKKESTSKKRSAGEDATLYEVLDSVEEDSLKEDHPTNKKEYLRTRKPRHGITKTEGATSVDSSEKAADEEESYQIVDSVEDESVNDEPPTDHFGSPSYKDTPWDKDQNDMEGTPLEASTKKEEEDESLFQVVDSLEGDQAQEEVTETETAKGEPPRKEVETEDSETCAIVVEASEKLAENSIEKVVDSLKALAERSGTNEEATTYEILDYVEDDPLTKEQPATKRRKRGSRGGKRQSLRTKGKTTSTTTTAEDSSEKAADEEESYQIVDSVEDESVSDKPGTDQFGSATNKDAPKDKDQHEKDGTPVEESTIDKEEEETFQVLDSLEDAQAQQEVTETEAAKDEPARKEVENQDLNTCSKVQEASEKLAEDGIEMGVDNSEALPVKSCTNEEATTYEVLDSVEDDPLSKERPARKRRKRGIPAKPRHRITKTGKVTSATTAEDSSEKAADEEETYQILDSVEDELVSIEPARDQFGSATNKDTPKDKDQHEKKDASLEESTKNEEEEEQYFEVVDSLEDDQAQVEVAVTKAAKDQPPRKEVETEDSVTCAKVPEASEKLTEDSIEMVVDSSRAFAGRSCTNEEAIAYEILDSVEDDPVMEDQGASKIKVHVGQRKPRYRKTKRGRAASTAIPEESSEKATYEEETYQILDSVEDELVNDEPTTDQYEKEGPLLEKSANNKEEKATFQVVDSLDDDPTQEEVSMEKVVDSSETPTKGSGASEEEKTPNKDIRKSPVKPQSDVVIVKEETNLKQPEGEPVSSTLVNLDEVSDEEDFPDDTAETEELRKRQAAAKEKQLMKDKDARGSRERERRSGSTSSSRGGGSRRGRRRGRMDEKVEVDASELLTTDEVWADDSKNEEASERKELEGEAQMLVTLDEFVDEEEGTKPEVQESAEELSQETLVTLDEAGYDEEETQREEQAKTPSRSAKQKHDAEDIMNFVIVDEVRDEEKEQSSTSKARSQPTKRGRQTPARRSTRGKNVYSQKNEEGSEQTDELQPSVLKCSTSLHKGQSKLANDDELEAQKVAEDESANQADIDAASAGPEDRMLGKCAEIGEEEREKSKVDIKVLSKQRRGLDGPEPKRSRSQSPSVPSHLKMPEFRPNNPLGKEFVVPGYFCSLCSVFYQSETNARELHCSSRTHFNNLQKHYQDLQKKSRSSTPSCQGSFSE